MKKNQNRKAQLLAEHEQALLAGRGQVGPEDLQWTILRLSNLPHLPASERSAQGGNGNTFCGHGFFGLLAGGPRIVHLHRVLVRQPDLNAGQGLNMLGPVDDLPDNALCRCMLYLNLAVGISRPTASAATSELPRMYLWLSGGYRLEQQLEELEAKWYTKHGMPKKKKAELLNADWREQGVRPFEVSYNAERVAKTLEFLQKNPTFGRDKPGIQTGQLLHETTSEPLYRPRTARESDTAGADSLQRQLEAERAWAASATGAKLGAPEDYCDDT